MSDTQTIKDNLDIVDLVGEYVQLKPAGSNHKGLCPFHNEKSPSFMVSRERQSWRCFGCNKGGDIFSFVQEIEGLEFVEALKLLADKAGVTLTHSFTGNTQAGEKKVRLKQIMAGAVQFYHQFLVQMDASAEARTYLQNRGLEPHTIDVWKIGFVPDQWDLLTKYLLKKGFAIDDLVDAGITIKRDGADRSSGRGYYDRFRGRIMFPINDAQGNPVGVTGRVLVETDKSGGKYVNTPQTEIYDKSRVLFGLDKAKAAIRQHDLVVVVEGQMDVISVWQSGMEHVVASSGTALTEEQVTLMKRYTKNIAMAFDMDKAGLAAAKRGIAIALEQGMRVRVIRIPDNVAKDPDECVKRAPDVWKQSVEEATDVLTWYITLAVSEHSLETARGKQAIANDVLPEIARIPYAVERDHWLGELAIRTGIERSVLLEDMQRYMRSSDTPKRFAKTTSVPVLGPISSRTDLEPTHVEQLLREWFALVCAFEELHITAFPMLHHVILTDPKLGALYEHAKIVYTEHTKLSAALLDTPTMADTVSECMLLGTHHFGSLDQRMRQDALDSLCTRMVQEDQKHHRNELIAALAIAEQQGDHATVADILSQLQ